MPSTTPYEARGQSPEPERGSPRGAQSLRGLTRLPPGMRPALLVEVQPPGRVGRHFAEHLAELAPLVQILDAPVPQVVDNVMDAFKFLDHPMTEQVIEVPRISCPPCPSRSQVPVPLTAEQLVEVPTVLSYSLLLQRTAEQTIGIAVPGRGGGARGGLHGLSQGQGSTAVSGADYVDTSVLGRGGGSRGGLHGLSEGQGSTAGCGADFVVSPVPHGRGGGTRGGRHGLSQGQGSTTFPPPERISERIMEQNVDFPGGGLHGVQGFLTGPAALSEQVPAPAVHAAPAPVGEFMASAPSVHAAPVSSGGDASRVEQDVGVEGVDFLGRVVFHTGTCVMLGVVDFKWRDLGVGTYGFLRDSTGATFFQFWRRRQLLEEDVISGLVLRGDSTGLTWRWRNPEFEDGPSDYRHAVRFQLPVLARRFYDTWNSS